MGRFESLRIIYLAPFAGLSNLRPPLSLCTPKVRVYFKVLSSSSLTASIDVSVPLDPTQFIINISKVLAREEPQLACDFLNEFFVGWESFPDDQKPLSLAYMAPWIPSLRTSLLPDESDSEKARDKIASIFRKLIDVTVLEPSLALTLEYTAWPAVYKDEVLLDIFVDEIVNEGQWIYVFDCSPI